MDGSYCTPSQEAYRAAMVLSGVGDALGYRNQRWEYCTSGPQIHQELQEMGGLGKIHVILPDWPVSDDTVLHLATAEALATGKTGESLFQELARCYVEAMKDMEGRKPGPTSILGTSQLRPGEPGGYHIPFNSYATGCGAAMRSMCIGLRYPQPSDLNTLIKVSIESGRMTHHHPTGYLGSLASALFTAYAVQGLPLELWGCGLLKTLPLALEYIQAAGIETEANVAAWPYFQEKWEWYLSERGLIDGRGPVRFPPAYGPAERDVIYKTFSLDGWAGRSGHDAPMIAYDALLGAGSSWEQLCGRSMFHGGDSDSTGVIAACCWGLTYGLQDIPSGNHMELEYRDRMVSAADSLYRLAWEQGSV
ncbi:PREDICTED: protein ADP-ribosylarginine hydrolase-like isoform X1 [Thamnophis sirtalis]|uniref:Protein ADP-ribosylarginine hydrolase-like isoform X1 n=2 Tax=Thamnophis sirtalis TaxID=35019 RepID=A0A6I9Z6Z6_9SAUR|nr:PREDICTED: protein ADP-ribosylarginine hydrolase-like isoform X1 [Thamnophis sirtalis]